MQRLHVPILVLAVLVLLVLADASHAQRQMEHLGRGVVAIRQADGGVFVGWRMLGTDPDEIAFNIYRRSGAEEPKKLNKAPITAATHFVDHEADADKEHAWFVRAVMEEHELPPSAAFVMSAGDPPRPYLAVPLKTPAEYRPNDASVGDLDGDGEYEIVLHQVGRGRDNSLAGFTTEPILEAYKLDGTRLWRIALGRNIREGAHYTQFMVYDLDGDGRAEVACKTADATVDGVGQVIGDCAADYRNDDGFIIDGPEYLTVFDGLTGAALATVDYIPPRGDVADWGDSRGNRADRFLACIAYLDGRRPSLAMCRGYYTRTVLAAWNWRDGKLTHVWTFDSDDSTAGNRAFRAQGNHSLSVGDVDGDGRDEIIYGSCVIDDNGTGLYSTGSGHGDSMHFTDVDPDHPGLEVFKANGDGPHPAGMQLRDAHTGEELFALASVNSDGMARAVAFDVDPRHRGLEMWGYDVPGGPRWWWEQSSRLERRAASATGLYCARGQKISKAMPRTCNMGVWWDGDLLRELLSGVRITKWNYAAGQEDEVFDGQRFGCVSINGSKSNPCLCADILGDWREEIVAPTEDGRELRIFTTTIPTEHRIYTLMHDPVYRLGVAWQNVSYNQSAHPGFYLGADMAPAPKPRIVTTSPATSQGAMIGTRAIGNQ